MITQGIPSQPGKMEEWEIKKVFDPGKVRIIDIGFRGQENWRVRRTESRHVKSHQYHPYQQDGKTLDPGNAHFFMKKPVQQKEQARDQV